MDNTSLKDRRRPAEEPGDGWFRSVIQNAPDVVMVLETDSCVRYVGPSVRVVLGYRPDAMVGTNLSRYLRPEVSGWTLNHVTGRIGSLRNPPAPVVFAVRHADASWRHLEAVSVDLLDDPQVRGIACYLREVTDRVALHEELRHRAFHDPLTGLANRALYMDRLRRALTRISRRRGRIAVSFVDLDRFKADNAEGGHGVGDRVLATIGRRLEACLRPSDTVARIGGDEFAVLLEDVADVDTAAHVAKRVIDNLRTPVALEDLTLIVSASVRIAMCDGGHHRGPEGLLRVADAAMYDAKARAGSDYAVSEEEARGGTVGVRCSTNRGRWQQTEGFDRSRGAASR